jgi:hypothetical protein
MTIVAALSMLTAVVAIKFPRIVGNSPSQATLVTTGQTGQSSTTVLATSTGATPQSSTAAAQATVVSGSISENILLACGGCNDPIQVTITTVQVDDANGHMVWNTTLKDVIGNDVNYQWIEYDLQASGTQTKIPATYSQVSGPLTSNNPYVMQATFAFVPLHNVTYTFTPIVNFYENTTGTQQIAFNPVQVSF